jgi:hypothetical protein
VFDEVLRFWFLETGPSAWWTVDPEFDALIAKRFGALLRTAERSELYVASCGLFDFRLQTVKTKPSREHLSRELIPALTAARRPTRAGEEWSSRHRGSQTAVRLRGSVKFTAAEGVRAAVIAGQGFAISSPELESGEVVPLLTKWRLPPIGLWVLTDPCERLEQSYSPSSGREAMYCR